MLWSGWLGCLLEEQGSQDCNYRNGYLGLLTRSVTAHAGHQESFAGRATLLSSHLRVVICFSWKAVLQQNSSTNWVILNY